MQGEFLKKTKIFFIRPAKKSIFSVEKSGFKAGELKSPELRVESRLFIMPNSGLLSLDSGLLSLDSGFLTKL
jgi:hypothetical protein